MASEGEVEIIEILEEAPDVIGEVVLAAPEMAAAGGPWLLLAIIFFLTFIIEETAIAASAYFVGSEKLLFLPAFIALYLGIFLSDFFLYSIGAFIRRSKWLARIINLNQYQSMVSKWMDKSIISTIVAARLVPGMLIPVFVFLGFTRTSVIKIGIVNLIVSGLYSVVVLYFLLYLGLKISDLVNLEVVVAVLGICGLFYYRHEILRSIKIQYQLMRSSTVKTWPSNTHHGMPTLKSPRRLTFFERLPYGFIYLPIWVSYFWNVARFQSFAAPTVCNPGIENSGICGESKSEILASISRQFAANTAEYTVLSTSIEPASIKDIDETISQAGLKFPLILKPDIGYMSHGIALAKSLEEICAYLDQVPEDQMIIAQEYIPSDGEAGIFFCRKPLSPEKVDVEVALTYYPFVTGDGESTALDLLMKDPRFVYFSEEYDLGELDFIPNCGQTVRLKMSGSAKDGSQHFDTEIDGIKIKGTPLFESIVAIGKSIPEFWLGRFDVKFESMESLLNGRFKIVELNGATGENLTAWDPRHSTIETYRRLFKQMRDVFEIGIQNSARGHKPVKGIRLLKDYLEQESILFRLAKALNERKTVSNAEKI